MIHLSFIYPTGSIRLTSYSYHVVGRRIFIHAVTGSHVLLFPRRGNKIFPKEIHHRDDVGETYSELDMLRIKDPSFRLTLVHQPASLPQEYCASNCALFKPSRQDYSTISTVVVLSFSACKSASWCKCLFFVISANFCADFGPMSHDGLVSNKTSMSSRAALRVSGTAFQMS